MYFIRFTYYFLKNIRIFQKKYKNYKKKKIFKNKWRRVTALLQMGDMSKSIQPLVIDPSFILWGDKFMQHISKLPYVVRWLNTGLHLIWPKYQHSKSYVDVLICWFSVLQILFEGSSCLNHRLQIHAARFHTTLWGRLLHALVLF